MSPISPLWHQVGCHEMVRSLLSFSARSNARARTPGLGNRQLMRRP